MKISAPKDVLRPNQGCRVDWWVFRPDFITGKRCKTNVLTRKCCVNARKRLKIRRNRWHERIQRLHFANSVLVCVVLEPPFAETASSECMFTQTHRSMYNSVQISGRTEVGSDIADSTFVAAQQLHKARPPR